MHKMHNIIMKRIERKLYEVVLQSSFFDEITKRLETYVAPTKHDQGRDGASTKRYEMERTPFSIEMDYRIDLSIWAEPIKISRI
jgi:hypothetical protein